MIPVIVTFASEQRATYYCDIAPNFPYNDWGVPMNKKEFGVMLLSIYMPKPIMPLPIMWFAEWAL